MNMIAAAVPEALTLQLFDPGQFDVGAKHEAHLCDGRNSTLGCSNYQWPISQAIGMVLDRVKLNQANPLASHELARLRQVRMESIRKPMRISRWTSRKDGMGCGRNASLMCRTRRPCTSVRRGERCCIGTSESLVRPPIWRTAYHWWIANFDMEPRA